jgi:hypothetical protein
MGTLLHSAGADSPARASVARSLTRITGEYQGTVTGIFMEMENVLAPLEDDGLRRGLRAGQRHALPDR